MGLPGYQVNLVDVPPVPVPPTDTGVGFVVGKATNAGVVQEVFSIDMAQQAIGARLADAPQLYDGVETFFREGGSHLWIATVADSALEAAVAAEIDTVFDDIVSPGQIAVWGDITPATQLALAAHAMAHDRVAILDGADTATAATLITAAARITGQTGDRFSAMFAPWDIIPGLTSGTTRTVPPSARIMGNIARNDGLGLSTNEPAAGRNGVAQYVENVTQKYSASDRLALNNAGVNVTKMVYNVPRTYGYRSLASQSTDYNWSFFSNSRCIMEIKNTLSVVCENFTFSKLDGQMLTIGRFKAAIAAALIEHWKNGDLFGVTANEAFNIDVGPSQNNVNTINAGEVHARVGLRPSPFAESLTIDVAKVPITQPLAFVA